MKKLDLEYRALFRKGWFWDTVFSVLTVVIVVILWVDYHPDSVEKQWAIEKERAAHEIKVQREIMAIQIEKTLFNAAMDMQMQRLTNNAPSGW